MNVLREVMVSMLATLKEWLIALCLTFGVCWLLHVLNTAFVALLVRVADGEWEWSVIIRFFRGHIVELPVFYLQIYILGKFLDWNPTPFHRYLYLGNIRGLFYFVEAISLLGMGLWFWIGLLVTFSH